MSLPDDQGRLYWAQEANDVAGNVTTTIPLGATNVRRIARQILLKYHCSSDADDRTPVITLRDVADTSGPTGFSIDADVWDTPALTLSANQEGIIFVSEHGFVSLNDNGTITYADNTTAPNPFPLRVGPGETADLIVAVGNGNANDDYDVFVQYEEWIED